MICHRPPPSRRGYSLIELTLAVLVLAVLAAMCIPAMSADVDQQLLTAAQIVSADLSWAQSLAVANGSTYVVRFDTATNRYVLAHSGTNAALNTMPPSPFRRGDDPAGEHRVTLSALPSLGADVYLVGAHDGTTTTPVTQVEFGPLGATTQTQPTVIWLTAGNGSRRRYVAIEINPVTGLTSIRPVQATCPLSLPATVSAT